MLGINIEQKKYIYLLGDNLKQQSFILSPLNFTALSFILW